MKQETFKKMLSAPWAHKADSYVAKPHRATIEDAVEILGVSKRTIWGWRRRGLMPPATKCWQLVYWLRSDIELLSTILLTNDGGNPDV